jgi:hypothetical protein
MSLDSLQENVIKKFRGEFGANYGSGKIEWIEMRWQKLLEPFILKVLKMGQEDGMQAKAKEYVLTMPFSITDAEKKGFIAGLNKAKELVEQSRPTFPYANASNVHRNHVEVEVAEKISDNELKQILSDLDQALEEQQRKI